MGFKANENAKEEKTDFYINDRFYGPRMSSTTQEQKIIFNFSRGSSLVGNPIDSKFTTNFKKGDEVNYTFNLKLSSDNVPERFKNMTMYDLMNSQDFLNILNSAFELPAFIIMTNGRDSETLAKIYFELVD